MMTKEEYKREIKRMWDSIRDDKYKGYYDYDSAICECSGVRCCEECALYGVDCGSSTNAFEMIEAVEKWSKEHPQKYKISPFEYEYLKLYQKYGFGSDRLCDLTGTTILHDILHELFYLKDIDLNVKVEDILLNCEVTEDD